MKLSSFKSVRQEIAKAIIMWRNMEKDFASEHTHGDLD
jgi:hypothetical protein